MKRRRSLLLISMLLAGWSALFSSGQAQVPPGDPDLSKFSDDQLVACFANWKICSTGEGQASGWPISDEVARRGNVHRLLVRYWTERNWEIRSGIEHIAYHFDTREVTQFMRRIVANRIYDGEDRYWPLNYLAKQCDATALKQLSTGRYRNQGSMQYQYTVALFGKCMYRPAIPYLIDEAVDDMSLNIVGAAEDDLRAFYPNGPNEFPPIDLMQKYYCSCARQEGFKVSCKAR